MFEILNFTQIEGIKPHPKLTLMTLSTCGFCKKAQIFLEGKNYAYQYIHLDLIDPEIKVKAKEEFFQKFQKNLSYPTLIIDDS